jgi:hypothetical protein
LLLYIVKNKAILCEFFSAMNRSFLLLSLLIGISFANAPVMASAQPRGEQVRPMSVVPTDEPALAPRPLRRSASKEQPALFQTVSNEEQRAQLNSIGNSLDLKSPLPSQ